MEAYWFVNNLLCDSSCLSSSIAKVTSTVYFILLIKSLGSFLNTSLGINIPSLPWFHWPWSLWSRFQTLYWDNHSFLTMVSSTKLKVIKEVLILKLKAYWFVNDLLCASSCLSSSVAKVTSTVSFILLIKSLESFSNTLMG